MNKAINRLRLLFCFFSGEDDYIIRKCSAKTQFFFAGVGALVIVIFIACWFSASHFISELFEDGNKWISMPIGIFWALLVANLYLLLLYTVAPAVLPISKYKKLFKQNRINIAANQEIPKSAINASLFLRIFFVSLLAIIIAQPLNVFLLEEVAANSLKTYIAEYKINLLISADSCIINKEIQTQKDYYLTKKYITPNGQLQLNLLDDKVKQDQNFMNTSRSILFILMKIDSVSNKTNKIIFKADSLRTTLAKLIKQEITSDADFLNNVTTISNADSINQYQLMAFKNELTANIKDKNEHYYKIENLLNSSNFYCKQIQILLGQSPLAWLITFIVIAIFIIPIRLKYIVRNKTNYYDFKRDIEKHIVLTEYQNFKKVYAKKLGNNLRTYNNKIAINLLILLDKLKKVNPQFEQKLKEEITAETTFSAIEKYEYWQDHPFRTTKKEEAKFTLNEYDLLTKIYN